MAPSQNIMMSRNLLRTTNFLFLAVSGASLLLTLTLLHCWHVSVNSMPSACLDFMHKQWDAFFCATILLWVALDLSLFSHFPLALVTFHLFLPYFSPSLSLSFELRCTHIMVYTWSCSLWSQQISEPALVRRSACYQFSRLRAPSFNISI